MSGVQHSGNVFSRSVSDSELLFIPSEYHLISYAVLAHSQKQIFSSSVQLTKKLQLIVLFYLNTCVWGKISSLVFPQSTVVE